MPRMATSEPIALILRGMRKNVVHVAYVCSDAIAGGDSKQLGCIAALHLVVTRCRPANI